MISSLYACCLFTVIVLGGLGQDPRAGGQPRNPKAAATAQAQIFVLCIGINDYSTSKFSQLRYAESDANELAETLKRRYGYEVSTLIGPDATRDNITAELYDKRADLSDDDSLIVYFAGHGQRMRMFPSLDVGFLVPFGTSLEPTSSASKFVNQGIDMANLSGNTKYMKGKHILLILDTCFGGLAQNARGTRPAERAQADKRTRQIITAGDADQLALEDDEFSHGVFSYYLIQALGTVEPRLMSDVFYEVSQKTVARAESAHGGAQLTPSRRDLFTQNGDFLFIPLKCKGTDADLFPQAAKKAEGLRTRGGVEPEQATVENANALRSLPEDQTVDGRLEQSESYSRQVQVWNEQARIDGNPNAMAALFEAYARGIGVPRDEKRAQEWARKANETGSEVGQRALSDSYRTGTGVPKDQIVAAAIVKFLDADFVRPPGSTSASAVGIGAASGTFFQLAGAGISSLFAKDDVGRLEVFSKALRNAKGNRDTIAKTLGDLAAFLSKQQQRATDPKQSQVLGKAASKVSEMRTKFSGGDLGDRALDEFIEQLDGWISDLKRVAPNGK